MMMMTTDYRPLVDSELIEFIRAGGIEGCPLSLVNPASVNFEIGTKAKIEIPTLDATGAIVGSTMKALDLSAYTKEDPYLLPPGGFILTDVQQYLRLPPNHEAQVILRSSAARAGFDHALAGYVDPSYEGRLTLEFVNCRKYSALGMYPGQQLVQLRIYKLSHTPDRGYDVTGRYHRATQVEANKDLTISAY